MAQQSGVGTLRLYMGSGRGLGNYGSSTVSSNDSTALYGLQTGGSVSL